MSSEEVARVLDNNGSAVTGQPEDHDTALVDLSKPTGDDTIQAFGGVEAAENEKDSYVASDEFTAVEEKQENGASTAHNNNGPDDLGDVEKGPESIRDSLEEVCQAKLETFPKDLPSQATSDEVPVPDRHLLTSMDAPPEEATLLASKSEGTATSESSEAQVTSSSPEAVEVVDEELLDVRELAESDLDPAPQKSSVDQSPSIELVEVDDTGAAPLEETVSDQSFSAEETRVLVGKDSVEEGALNAQIIEPSIADDLAVAEPASLMEELLISHTLSSHSTLETEPDSFSYSLEPEETLLATYEEPLIKTDAQMVKEQEAELPIVKEGEETDGYPQRSFAQDGPVIEDSDELAMASVIDASTEGIMTVSIAQAESMEEEAAESVGTFVEEQSSTDRIIDVAVTPIPQIALLEAEKISTETIDVDVSSVEDLLVEHDATAGSSSAPIDTVMETDVEDQPIESEDGTLTIEDVSTEVQVSAPIDTVTETIAEASIIEPQQEPLTVEDVSLLVGEGIEEQDISGPIDTALEEELLTPEDELITIQDVASAEISEEVLLPVDTVIQAVGEEQLEPEVTNIETVAPIIEGGSSEPTQTLEEVDAEPKVPDTIEAALTMDEAFIAVVGDIVEVSPVAEMEDSEASSVDFAVSDEQGLVEASTKVEQSVGENVIKMEDEATTEISDSRAFDSEDLLGVAPDGGPEENTESIVPEANAVNSLTPNVTGVLVTTETMKDGGSSQSTVSQAELNETTESVHVPNEAHTVNVEAAVLDEAVPVTQAPPTTTEADVPETLEVIDTQDISCVEADEPVNLSVAGDETMVIETSVKEVASEAEVTEPLFSGNFAEPASSETEQTAAIEPTPEVPALRSLETDEPVVDKELATPTFDAVDEGRLDAKPDIELSVAEDVAPVVEDGSKEDTTKLEVPTKVEYIVVEPLDDLPGSATVENSANDISQLIEDKIARSDELASTYRVDTNNSDTMEILSQSVSNDVHVELDTGDNPASIVTDEVEPQSADDVPTTTVEEVVSNHSIIGESTGIHGTTPSIDLSPEPVKTIETAVFGDVLSDAETMEPETSSTIPDVEGSVPEPLLANEDADVPPTTDAVGVFEDHTELAAEIGPEKISNLSVNTEIERPKSPWTPSYSVISQGPSVTVEEDIPEIEQLPPTNGSADAESKVPAVNIILEENETTILKADETQSPSRPSSPWVPSYSVSVQGSPSISAHTSPVLAASDLPNDDDASQTEESVSGPSDTVSEYILEETELIVPSLTDTREEIVESVPVDSFSGEPSTAFVPLNEVDIQEEAHMIASTESIVAAQEVRPVEMIKETPVEPETILDQSEELRRQEQTDTPIVSDEQASTGIIDPPELELEDVPISATLSPPEYTAGIERPRSPWGSYEVMNQSGSQTPLQEPEIAVEAVEVPASFIANDPVTESSEKPTPEHQDTITLALPATDDSKLNVGASHTDIPERPQSPWTPSYSVRRQGSGVFNEVKNDRELAELESLSAAQNSTDASAKEEVIPDEKPVVHVHESETAQVSETFPSTQDMEGPGSPASLDTLGEVLTVVKDRKRLESTASSLFFPGGWFSKPPAGRASLDIAQGEIISPKTVSSPTSPVDEPSSAGPESASVPTSSTTEGVDNEKKGKWCVIM